MNRESSTFTIGVIGFEKAECRMLQRVVGLSEHRQPTFGPFNKEQGGCPHVVVVNADQRSAIDRWNGFRRANAHRASFAPIFVSRQPTDLPCPGPYVLYRPILTTQLFSVLDQVVTEVHGYRPVSKVETAALMVDDSLSARARLQMREAMTSIASRVDFAESGEMALKLIDVYAYSVIFVDALLSDDDAYEICARIKKHPLQQRASTVMLTGNSSPAERVMGMLAGFDNFLSKPIRREGLNELAAELGRPAAAI